MINKIKRNFTKNLTNIPGWITNRKIVVLESDDWGGIRMPSRNAYNSLINKGLNLTEGDSQRYNLYDTLATPEDLTSLFETLSSIIDSKGNSAVFTAVSVVANPDFEKIKNNGFQKYFYEPFTKTLNRYHGNDQSYQLWKEGIAANLFVPQFHGREHLNVAAWMKALQKNDPETHLAFEHGLWGFNNKHPYGVSYQAAFDLTDPEEIKEQKKIISDGLILFENLFGYKATYFVPPNGPFNKNLESEVAKSGIKYLYGDRFQHEALGYGKTRLRIHYLGQQSNEKLRYVTRNCFFEPSMESKNWINSCLSDIEISFRWHKPAVISSHRVNYIGSIVPSNRDRGLKQLKELLSTILHKWPEVEFMSTAQLGNIINWK